jgi:hypothetical protein
MTEGSPFLLLVQEHRLGTDSAITEARLQLRRLGINSTFTPAEVGPKGGWSGGAAVLWTHTLQARTLPVKLKRSTLVQLCIDGRFFHLARFCGSSHSAAVTYSALRELLRTIDTDALPCVIGGDFNLEPQAARLIVDEHDPTARLISVGPTCYTTGPAPTTLDFFVCLRGPVPLVRAHNCPTSLATHRAVQLDLQVRHTPEAPRWIRPPRPQTSSVVGPGIWLQPQWDDLSRAIDHFARTLGSSFLSGMASGSDREVQRLWTGWCQLAARELQAATGNETEDFSAPLNRTDVPPSLLGGRTSALPAWCRRRTAEALATGQNGPFLLHKARTRRSMAKHGPLPDWSRLWLDDVCRHAETPSHSTVSVLQKWQIWLLDQIAAQEGADRERRLAKARQRRELLATTLSRDSFRRLRDPEPPDFGGAVHEDGSTHFSPDAILRQQKEIWSKWWGDAGTHHAHRDILPEILKLAPQVLVEPISPQVLRQVASTFATGTCSTDGLHPRHLVVLSDQAIAMLSRMFHIFDIAGWPPSEQQLLVKLIPKKDAGLRPIALFRTAYRVYAKARMWQFRSWMLARDRLGINTAGGRHTLDAA